MTLPNVSSAMLETIIEGKDGIGGQEACLSASCLPHNLATAKNPDVLRPHLKTLALVLLRQRGCCET